MSSDEGEGAINAAGCAYLILSHKDPRQVEALTDRILGLSPRADVVIHHDLKDDLLPWDGRPPARVHLVERTAVEHRDLVDGHAAAFGGGGAATTGAGLVSPIFGFGLGAARGPSGGLVLPLPSGCSGG